MMIQAFGTLTREPVRDLFDVSWFTYRSAEGHAIYDIVKRHNEQNPRDRIALLLSDKMNFILDVNARERNFTLPANRNICNKLKAIIASRRRRLVIIPLYVQLEGSAYGHANVLMIDMSLERPIMYIFEPHGYDVMHELRSEIRELFYRESMPSIYTDLTPYPGLQMLESSLSDARYSRYAHDGYCAAWCILLVEICVTSNITIPIAVRRLYDHFGGSALSARRYIRAYASNQFHRFKNSDAFTWPTEYEVNDNLPLDILQSRIRAAQ